MELRHLRYFEAVAIEQHVRRAADRLHIAQPALTRQIADLEEELGCKLFDRLPRGIRINAAGEAFLVHTRKILGAVGEAVAATRRTSEGQEGQLTIGFVESASWDGVFARTIQRFRSRYPALALQLMPMLSTDQITSLSSRAIDAGFLYVFDGLPKIISTSIARDDSVMLAVPRHYGWRKRRPIRISELKDEKLIWIRRESAPRYIDLLNNAVLASGLSPQIVQEAVDETTMLALVSAGVGVGFVNSANLTRKPSTVDFVEVAGVDLRLRLRAAWRRDNTSPALKNFLATLKCSL